MMGVDIATEMKGFRLGPTTGPARRKAISIAGREKNLPMEDLMSPLHFSPLICKRLMV
jgi:hypothetical protein